MAGRENRWDFLTPLVQDRMATAAHKVASKWHGRLDPAELISEVLIRLVQARELGRLPAEAVIVGGGWLGGVMRHAALDIVRSRSREQAWTCRFDMPQLIGDQERLRLARRHEKVRHLFERKVERLQPPLSARQREVVDLLRRGLSVAQVASQLRLDRRTVEEHANAIRRRLAGGLGAVPRGALPELGRSHLEELSHSERLLYAAWRSGGTRRQVARELGLAPATVKAAVRRLRARLRGLLRAVKDPPPPPTPD